MVALYCIQATATPTVTVLHSLQELLKKGILAF